MKKWIALLLAALFVLSLIGCGSSKDKSESPQTEQNDPTNTVTTTDPEPTQEPEPEATPEPTEEPEPEATPEPTEEPEPEATPEPEEQWEPLGKVETTPINLPKGYTVTEIGTLPDPDRRITYRTDGVLIKRNNGGEDTPDAILNYLGEEIPGGPYYGCKALGDGYYAIVKVSEDVNSTGLINDAGEFLIPPEAAIIKRMSGNSYKNDSDRYLIVIYSTGEVQSQEEAFFYVTDRYFAIGGPEEGDKMYAGYAKIYDLETRRFIDGITVTNPSSSATKHMGDYFALADTDGSTAIYDCNGQKTLQFAKSAMIECGKNFVIVAVDYDKFEIYSGNGDLLYQAEDRLELINGSDLYVEKTHYDYDKPENVYTVMDYFGNQCFTFEAKYADVSEEHGGVFLISESDRNRLVDLNGAEIFATENYLSYEDYGCWQYSYSVDDNYINVLVLPDGTTIEDKDGYFYLFISKTKTGDGITEDYQYEMLVLNDPEHPLILQADYVRDLADGLVMVEINRMRGVYDLFSGKELIAPEYKDIFYVYGNLYALKDGVWTIFKPELN